VRPRVIVEVSSKVVSSFSEVGVSHLGPKGGRVPAIMVELGTRKNSAATNCANGVSVDVRLGQDEHGTMG
jgi:hypothetical protein